MTRETYKGGSIGHVTLCFHDNMFSPECCGYIETNIDLLFADYFLPPVANPHDYLFDGYAFKRFEED